MALRNIDHLIPPDLAEPYRPQEVDFYWMKVMNRKERFAAVSASPRLWAVQGEHLLMVLERWKSAWNELGNDAMLTEAAVWSQVVRDLPLRKKSFELKRRRFMPRGSAWWIGSR